MIKYKFEYIDLIKSKMEENTSFSDQVIEAKIQSIKFLNNKMFLGLIDDISEKYRCEKYADYVKLREREDNLSKILK